MKVDQGTDPLSEDSSLTEQQTEVDQKEAEFTNQPLRVDQATGTEDMGSGASKDGEVVDDDEQYVQQTEKKKSSSELAEHAGSSSRDGLKQRPSLSRRLTRQSVNSLESSRTYDKNNALKYIGKK